MVWKIFENRNKKKEAQVADAISKAVTSLYPRIRSLEIYTDNLSRVDATVADITNQAVKQASRTYWITGIGYLLKNIAAATVLGIGLYFMFFEQNVDLITPAIICIVGGFTGLLLLSSRSYHRSTRSLMANTIKLNVIISGYTRQIHQIDTAFKGMFSSETEIEQSKIEYMLALLQDAVDEAMNAITQVTDEMND